MLICIPYCSRDKSRASALINWIAELGNVSSHDVILFPDEGIDYREELRVASSCFRSAKASPIDLCSTDKWPIGANHCFKRIVDYVDHFKLYPFVMLETDAIPLHPQWLNQIADEYATCGKPFMGYLEYAGDPGRQHMNGAGVYGDVYKYAPKLTSAPTDDNGANYLAFDWAGGPEVVPQMHVTKLIQFQYKKEAELLKDETLSWLKPEAVVFHTCKDLRIIPMLRKKLGMAELSDKKARISLDDLRFEHDFGKLAEHRASLVPVQQSGLSCDIFIKTYDKVADWHAFAMRSIERYCSGFRNTVIVGHQAVESYQEMQVHKLNADLYTDADYILTTDSDTIFATPVTPQTYMRDGKTIWLHRSWESAHAQEGDAVLRWKRGMERFFGQAPREFMCRHPELLPRWLYSAFRIFCFERHGKTMAEWVREDKEFADWNMLGCYAWLFHHEAFHWIDQDAETPPPITVKQYWGGHTPIEPHVAEMEAILAGGVEVKHEPPGPVARTKEPKAKQKRGKKMKRKFSPERLEALRANMAKARAAKKSAIPA